MIPHIIIAPAAARAFSTAQAGEEAPTRTQLTGPLSLTQVPGPACKMDVRAVCAARVYAVCILSLSCHTKIHAPPRAIRSLRALCG